MKEQRRPASMTDAGSALFFQCPSASQPVLLPARQACSNHCLASESLALTPLPSRYMTPSRKQAGPCPSRHAF
jgi:hypothetical protein